MNVKQTKSVKILFLAVALLCLCGVSFAQNTNETTIDEEEGINQYGVRVKSYPLQAKAQNEILVLQNKEKGYKFWMDNRVQFDGAHYFGLKNGMIPAGSEEPAMPGGVSLRRVRMAVKAEIAHNWYGEVDVNFANGVFELEDAYIMFIGLKGFEFKAGNFKEDFSMEQTTTSRYTTFMERPMIVATFAPSRHAGIQANWIQFPWIRASAGVSWQIVDTWQTRYNVEEINKEGGGMGTNVAWKAVFMPWGAKPYHGLHLGYNGSFRDARKVDDNLEDLNAITTRGYGGDYYSTRNSTAVNRTKFIRTEFYGVKHDWLHGFELAGYKDGFRFQGEYMMNYTVMDEDLKYSNWYRSGAETNMETKMFNGFYIQACYLLFGGKNRYDVTQSEFTQPTRGKSWGDIEVMARFDYINLNSEDLRKGSGLRGGAGQNIALGVVYHINNNVKFMVNYQYSQNDIYAGNRGRAAIGKDVNGDYTTNPLDAVSDIGIRFNTLQARIEIAF